MHTHIPIFLNYFVIYETYPYIICLFRLYEVVETHGRVYLVTEWIQGGELYNRITEEGKLTEVYAVHLFKQLLLAVQHMVSMNLYKQQMIHYFSTKNAETTLTTFQEEWSRTCV